MAAPHVPLIYSNVRVSVHYTRRLTSTYTVIRPKPLLDGPLLGTLRLHDVDILSSTQILLNSRRVSMSASEGNVSTRMPVLREADNKFSDRQRRSMLCVHLRHTCDITTKSQRHDSSSRLRIGPRMASLPFTARLPPGRKSFCTSLKYRLHEYLYRYVLRDKLT